MKLQNYILRYLIISLLIVIALWASIFYLFILDEVSDNIDDGLKNAKLLIIREAYKNPEILNTPEYGINQFKITPLPKGEYSTKNQYINTFEYMEYDDDDEPIRLLKTIFYDAKGNPHLLQIKASTVEEDELLEDLLTALIALYLMLVISIIIINHWILRQVWNPFQKLLFKLQTFKLGNGLFKTPETPFKEFQLLGMEIEKMLARNEATYISQKQFLENAAHELQTPLAITINKLELFAEHHTITEQQISEIGSITDTLTRLVRLNKSLLVLSKIENKQFTDEETIHLNTLTEQIVEDFSDLANYKNVSIQILAEEELIAIMNKGLAITLINNLLKNAIIHNHPNGSIVITLTKTSFSIKNSSLTHPLNAENIYNRFYRHTTHEQSTGLGLAIVKSIISNYPSMYIDYTFNEGHIFTIYFS